MQPMEIPDEAVAAAARVFFGAAYGSVGDEGNKLLHDGAREALEAALPYLAPAGDGGLREAVEDLRAWCDMQREAAGHDETEYAAGEFLAYKRVRGHLLKILAAHPATPAVPQPVDREALVRAIVATKSLSGNSGTVLGGMFVQAVADEVADAVLALLAGEQGTGREPGVVPSERTKTPPTRR